MRFAGREPVTQAVVVKDLSLPLAQSVAVTDSHATPSSAQTHSNAAIRSALHAGVIAAVLSLLPVRSAFVFALPFAGFLAVLFYRRRSLVEEPAPSQGFRVGSLAGFFGFVIFLLLTAVQVFAFRAQNEFRDTMIQAIRQAQARSPDPQARQMLEYFMTPQGLVFMMAFGFLLMCIIFALLGGIGGAVSASLLRRKRPPS